MLGNFHFPLRLKVLVVITIVIDYYRQKLEEISPHTVEPIMLKLHTKFQISSMDGSQVLASENLCVHKGIFEIVEQVIRYNLVWASLRFRGL
jgi:hypothetical protein